MCAMYISKKNEHITSIHVAYIVLFIIVPRLDYKQTVLKSFPESDYGIYC